MQVLVTGASGLVGRSLCVSLGEQGHTVIALSRSPDSASGVQASKILKWDPMAGPPPAEALAGIEAVVHLAGEPIAAHRWTEEQKKRIRESRVVSTRNLVDGMRDAVKRPAVFVCGSAVGFYGSRGDEQLEEDSTSGQGFLSELCQEWEREADRARDLSIRVVKVRTGVVLARDGGALQKMLPPFKLGLGGPLGSGRHWFAWIHIKDIAGIFVHAIHNMSVTGPINGVAPESVTNAEFTRQLGRVLGRPAFIPVPEFAMRALMGEMADILFVSQRVVPKAALASGYEFHFPQLQPALANLLNVK
jgi:uncharacterized protein